METLSEIDSKYVRGWSWSAFLGSWIYLFVHKQKKMAVKFVALFILLQLISYVPIIKASSDNWGVILGTLYLGLGIWLGIRGREIVWKSGVYSSIEEFKKNQKLAAKLVVIFMIIMFAINMSIAMSNVNKAISNPEEVNQKIEQQALLKAKSSDSSIVDAEFGQGYKKGTDDGKIDLAPGFIADQTTSFQSGYKYGYSVACMQLHNDQITCLKKITGK